MKRFILFLLVATLGFIHSASAQVPLTLGYQGVLTEASGTPLADGDYNLTFKLYDVATGGAALWTETQTASVFGGVFSVALGSATALNLPFDTAYWLGVSVGTDAELDPRVALTASPYSLSSRGTVNEPADGDSFAIRTSDGETAHLLSPDGDVEHAGIGFFGGGIFVGSDTTAFVLPDSIAKNVAAAKQAADVPAIGIRAEGTSAGVFGISASGWAVNGQSESGIGARGRSVSGVGVIGESTSREGVSGLSESGIGVFGKSTSRPGVQGESTTREGVSGLSESGIGVFGKSTSRPGIQGESTSSEGVHGLSESGIGVFGKSTSGEGVTGQSDSRTGVFGTSTSGRGVSAISASGTGLRAEGNPAGNFVGQVKISDIPLDQNNCNVLVWGSDTVVKYKVLCGTGGGGEGAWLVESESIISTTSDVLIRDSGGNITTRFNADGTSFHEGEETFGGGIIIEDMEGTIVSVLDSEGYKVVNSNGDVIGGLGRTDLVTGQRLGVFGFAETSNDLAGSFDGNVEVKDGDFTMRDSEGNVIFQVNSDGTSFHKGEETFEKGIKILDSFLDVASTLDGSGLRTFDSFGDLNGGLGLRDQTTGVRTGVFGRGSLLDLAGRFDGDVDVNDGDFTMRDDEGNVIFQVTKFGTSFHKGKEKFAGGIEVINANGSIAMSILPDQSPSTGYTTTINGNLIVTGMISKTSSTFRIDHPLDPENKFLYHSVVESPDMMNVYNGNVVLDEAGGADVPLPSYFEALNMDFRYQLTSIGAPGPNLYIAEQVQNNQFKISGGTPGLEVSWQVTGIRQDKWAKENRIQVEVDKEPSRD